MFSRASMLASFSHALLALFWVVPPFTTAQYGSRTKMNVVPVTIGALAPTNDTFASFT